jgi:hypothetical protein
MKKKYAAGVAALVMLASAPASAQTATSADTAPAVTAVPAMRPQTGNVLPSNTEVLLTANREVNSKSVKQGDKFDLTVARDVMLGNFIVIPRGTRGWGRVSYRTGKGAFGKSAKFEFDLTDIDLNGRMIPLTGHYRVEGQGNTGVAVGAVVAVGVFGAFVTGHSAVVSQGAEYKAFTREPLPVALPADTAASQTTMAPSGTTTAARN